MSKALEKNVIAFVHFDVFRRRLNDERFAVNDQSPFQIDGIVVTGIGQHAGQIAVIFSIQRIEDQIPIARVHVVFSVETSGRLIELKNLIVRGQEKLLVIVQSMKFPTDLNDRPKQ